MAGFTESQKLLTGHDEIISLSKTLRPEKGK